MSTQRMEPTAPDQARLAEAQRRVAALKGFYTHLAIFAVVMLALLVLNAALSGGWWVQWVFFGWGIGVAAHALAVFGVGSKTVSAWEQRKIEQILREQQR